MFKKQWKRKGFHKDIGGHVGSGNPMSAKGTIHYVITNKMVMDVDVFRMRGNH
jgi:hypothetical protein